MTKNETDVISERDVEIGIFLVFCVTGLWTGLLFGYFMAFAVEVVLPAFWIMGGGG